MRDLLKILRELWSGCVDGWVGRFFVLLLVALTTLALAAIGAFAEWLLA
jgi:hypothetical protein